MKREEIEKKVNGVFYKIRFNAEVHSKAEGLEEVVDLIEQIVEEELKGVFADMDAIEIPAMLDNKWLGIVKWWSAEKKKVRAKYLSKLPEKKDDVG